jgi:hypothetical protein
MKVIMENMQTEITVTVVCDCGHIQLNKVEEELNFINCRNCEKELIVDVSIVKFPDVFITEVE